ncbi:hypothetical protein [Streptomyces rimosus]|uniref:hypothetical protein n=1 Tax=Streptomyces rimosus TaxID=1927 RepID=UPI00379B6D7D
MPTAQLAPAARPYVLSHLTPLLPGTGGATAPQHRYDPARQLVVDDTGAPVVSSPVTCIMAAGHVEPNEALDRMGGETDSWW